MQGKRDKRDFEGKGTQKKTKKKKGKKDVLDSWSDSPPCIRLDRTRGISNLGYGINSIALAGLFQGPQGTKVKRGRKNM